MSIYVDIRRGACYAILMTRKNSQKCCGLDLDKTGDALKAISEASRLKIICFLRTGEKCVCQIQALLSQKHNLVCHHLKALKKIKLIKSRKDGHFNYYKLDNKEYKKFIDNINKLLGVKDV